MIAIIFLSGCFVAPPHEAATGDPGPYPAQYEKIIRDYLAIHLGDPESFKDFSVQKAPEKVAIENSHPLIPLYKGQEVWEAFIIYNAKNIEGIYTGRDLHVVWIRHNRLVAFDYEGTELEYRIPERLENSGY